jgi:PBP1b-binding outer membrane lipoprotein LpoB
MKGGNCVNTLILRSSYRIVIVICGALLLSGCVMAEKTALTPEEKVRAAAAKLMYGTTDAEIALILGVTNHGRVNEAIKEILAPLDPEDQAPTEESFEWEDF